MPMMNRVGGTDGQLEVKFQVSSDWRRTWRPLLVQFGGAGMQLPPAGSLCCDLSLLFFFYLTFQTRFKTQKESHSILLLMTLI